MFERNRCFFVLFLILGLGCSSLSTRPSITNKSLFRGSPDQVRDRLLAKIPVGMSRIDAERQVESLGLTKSAPSAIAGESPPFISCRYLEKSLWFGETIWLIQIDCPDGKVSDIICEQIGIQ
ncbi:MAG: hypothetical protein MUC83_11930 [Pirellula sp.]|jgi:hypothetical protein|nr:hypothetical protein [Pirellula sp.]